MKRLVPWALCIVVACVAASRPAIAESGEPGSQVTASDGDFVVVLSAAKVGTRVGEPIRMGEPVELQFVATSSATDMRVQWPDLRGALTAEFGDDVEVYGGRQKQGGRGYAATLRFYDVGPFELPALPVAAWTRDADGTETPLGSVELDGLVLEVPVSVPEDAEPRPSDGMLDVPVFEKPTDWRARSGIAGIVAAVLAVLALAFLLVRRRMNEPAPAPPPTPPHVAALDALHELAQRGLAERGEVDAYFVGLTGILRRYLEDRFGLRAPEQTTQEFLHEVTSTREGRAAVREAHRAVLRDFLTQSDLVKFARETPTVAACLEMGETAEAFVRETAPTEEEAEDADDPEAATEDAGASA